MELGAGFRLPGDRSAASRLALHVSCIDPNPIHPLHLLANVPDHRCRILALGGKGPVRNLDADIASQTVHVPRFPAAGAVEFGRRKTERTTIGLHSLVRLPPLLESVLVSRHLPPLYGWLLEHPNGAVQRRSHASRVGFF
jgi:hypothetical protein